MSIVLNSSGGGSVTINEPTTASDFTATLPASSGTILSTGSPQSGGVIQVVSTTKVDTFTMTSTTQVAITGLTATITPKFSTSTILVMVTIGGYAQGSGQGRFILTRGGSTISGAVGVTAGSRLSDSFTIAMASGGVTQVTGGIQYLDSPATTSPTTYGLSVSSNDGGQAIYINYSLADSDNNGAQRNISTITLMEIAA